MHAFGILLASLLTGATYSRRSVEVEIYDPDPERAKVKGAIVALPRHEFVPRWRGCPGAGFNLGLDPISAKPGTGDRQGGQADQDSSHGAQ